MDITLILQRAQEVVSAIVSKPIIYFPLIGAWVITGLYFIINKDEKHGHTYVMSTGIALVFTAYIISPFNVPEITWSFSDLRTVVVILLFFYGLILTVLGIMRSFPNFMAEFFGDPGHALIPSLMAILYIEEDIPFDWTTFFAVATPVLILSIIKVYRRHFSR